MAGVVVLIVLVTACSSTKELRKSKRMQSKLEREVIGTWITKNGSKKLVIDKREIVYTTESIVQNCKYETMSFDFEKNSFFLQPMYNNEEGVLYIYRKFKYHNHSLFGSIKLYDYGIVENEFRKVW